MATKRHTVSATNTQEQKIHIRLEEMYAGLALFFSMYYIPGVNPEILKMVGMPVSATLFGTFLAIIAGNLSGVYATRTGLMIAPAVGISAFFASFVQSSQPHLDWRHGMVGCLIAGTLFAATSCFTNLRDQIVADLPESISKAAKAAIGALLVKKAFDLFIEGTQSHLNTKLGIVFVSLGVAIIILFFLLRNKLSHTNTRYYYLISFLLRTEFVIVVSLVTFLLYKYQGTYIDSLPLRTEFAFLWQDPSIVQPWNWDFDKVILISVFAGVIWFVVMSDIPGTPSEVLPDALKTSESGRAVRKGFLNDGIFTLLSPMFGTTPTIYYAENQILRDFGVYSKNVGLWTIAIFCALFIGILVSQEFNLANLALGRLIPPVAVIPILLFIGMYIIAVSFWRVPDYDQVSLARSTQYYLPSAIAVILTPRIGLEYAYPLAILSYWLVRGETDVHGPTFGWISVGAGISLFVFIMVFLFGTQ